MTVITLPTIMGLVWVLGDVFSVREHGELLQPGDAAEFLACAPVAREP